MRTRVRKQASEIHVHWAAQRNNFRKCKPESLHTVYTYTFLVTFVCMCYVKITVNKFIYMTLMVLMSIAVIAIFDKISSCW